MILSSTRSISAFARASGSLLPRDFVRCAEDGTRRADDLRHGHPLPQDERRCGSPDTAEEIKQQEQATTHPVLDRRAEDEQHQHVEQDVRNTCVQEHVGDERPRILPGTRGGKPERAGKARGCQQRALNEKYEQVGDEQSSYPWW